MPVAYVEGVGVKRYEPGPTPLGYQRTASFEFNVTQFRAEPEWPAPPPVPCEEHYPNCFVARAWWAVPIPHTEAGTWYMLTPIDVPSWLPGRDRRLVKLTAAAMDTNVSWWPWARSRLEIWVDGAKRWDSGEMPSQADAWRNLEYSLNIPLPDGAKKVELRIYEAAGFTVTGSITRHVAGWDGGPITLYAVYYTDEPPPTADVLIRVLDRYKATPVRGAYVALKVGDAVKADGFTDPDGRVVFKNIEEGEYALHVFKEGYHPLAESIEVRPPKVDRTVYLTPVPARPFPWEWVAVGAAVVVGGGTAIALARRRARKE